LLVSSTNVLLGVVRGADITITSIMDEGVEEILEEPFFSDVVLRRVALLEFLAFNLGVSDGHAVFAEIVLVGFSSLDGPWGNIAERGK